MSTIQMGLPVIEFNLLPHLEKKMNGCVRHRVGTHLTMCSNCQEIIIGYSIPHIPKNCPLNRISHCAICACYTNHTTQECNDHEVKPFRRVTYIEQLIPHSLLTHHSITSRTPIPNPVDLPGPRFEPVFEVEDTEKAVNQILRDYEIPISGKFKENRRRLKCLADELGRKLVYIHPK